VCRFVWWILVQLCTHVWWQTWLFRWLRWDRLWYGLPSRLWRVRTNFLTYQTPVDLTMQNALPKWRWIECMIFWLEFDRVSILEKISFVWASILLMMIKLLSLLIPWTVHICNVIALLFRCEGGVTFSGVYFKEHSRCYKLKDRCLAPQCLDGSDNRDCSKLAMELGVGEHTSGSLMDWWTHRNSMSMVSRHTISNRLIKQLSQTKGKHFC